MDRAYSLNRVKNQFRRVERKKGARQHPSRALVSVNKRMVARQTESVCRGESAQVILAIFPFVARARKRAFERGPIANPGWTAMLRELTIMDRSGHRRVKPDGFEPDGHGKLLCEFAQDIAIFAHYAFRHFHFLREGRIGGGQPNAIRRFGDIKLIPRPNAQTGEHLLGQDNPGGIADFGDLERLVHTGVITARL